MISSTQIRLLILLLASLLGLAGYLLLSPWVPSKEISYFSADGLKLRGRLYSGGSGSRAAVIFCQGMGSSKELLAIFAAALAEQGLTVLVPDWRGQGESPRRLSPAQKDAYQLDLQAAIAYLREEGISSSQLALVGHSMGATVAVQFAAQSRELRAVVTYGMDSVAPALPHFMLATGYFDEYYPPARVSSAFAQLPAAQDHRLVLVPASHYLENLNPVLIEAVSAWLGQAFAIPSDPAAAWRANRVLCFGVCAWGLLGLSLYLLQRLLSGFRSPRRLSLAAALAALVLLPVLAPQLPKLWASHTAVWLWAAVLLANAVHSAGQDPEQGLKSYFLLTLAYLWLMLVYGLVLVFNARASLASVPGALTAIPEFLLRLGLSLPWMALQGIKSWLFTSYSRELTPGLLWGLLWLVEIALPGWPGRVYRLSARKAAAAG